jgi:hypothetical protein
LETKGMSRIAKIRKGKRKTETVQVGVGRRKKSPNQSTFEDTKGRGSPSFKNKIKKSDEPQRQSFRVYR